MTLLNTITRGRTANAPRIVLYGMEGIGKSTFSANMPNPIFIQTEDGLSNIDCASFPLAKSFQDVLEQLDAVATEKNDFQTVVVDSLDWLERLVFEAVSNEAKVESIESIPFGKGYVFALSYWKNFLDVCTKLHEQNKIILFTAHAVAEDYSDPEVSGLKRFTPRLHKTARSLISEYVDVILLATRKYGAARGEKENPRVIRSESTPYQVAKSRYSIPNEMPLEASILIGNIIDSQKN